MHALRALLLPVDMAYIAAFAVVFIGVLMPLEMVVLIFGGPVFLAV